MSLRDSKHYSKIKNGLPLVYLIIALLALRWTIVEPYVVPTPSMEPTLKPGDRLYALKCAYDVRFPFTDWVLFNIAPVKRGDVILFRAPHVPSLTYVKRAIALEGDTVEVRNGIPYVNGVAYEREPAKNLKIMYDIDRREEKSLYIETAGNVNHYMILDSGVQNLRYRGEVVVPKDHVFAMGDNRDHSSDSRAWGFVPMKNMKGRAMFLWFSSWDWRIRTERVGTLIQ